MRRVLLVPLIAVLAATGFTAAPAFAKRKPSCAKQLKADGAKVRGRQAGIVVGQRRSSVYWCREGKRGINGGAGFDAAGAKATTVRANKRCIAVLGTSATGLPQFIAYDTRYTDQGTVFTAGFGAAQATVGSVALASNCALAWGQTADGTSTIKAYGITGASALEGMTLDAATVSGPAATKGVTARADGRKVVVGFSDGGPKTVTLPAG